MYTWSDRIQGSEYSASRFTWNHRRGRPSKKTFWNQTIDRIKLHCIIFHSIYLNRAKVEVDRSSLWPELLIWYWWCWTQRNKTFKDNCWNENWNPLAYDWTNKSPTFTSKRKKAVACPSTQLVHLRRLMKNSFKWFSTSTKFSTPKFYSVKIAVRMNWLTWSMPTVFIYRAFMFITK